MARSFLAVFRSADARSLARALILLLVLSSGFDAFHAGGMAAVDGTGGVGCSVSGASTVAPADPYEMPQSRGWSCCVLGCASLLTGIIATNDVPSPVIVWAEAPGRQLLASSVTVAFDRPGNVSPRGPPRLA
jgi:hypothetical protein